MNNTIAKQFSDIANAMRTQMNEDAKPYMVSQTKFIAGTILNGMNGFYGVTGNTFNSVAVGCYLNGTLQGMALSSEILNHDPTRETLIEGESYNLKYYWGGDLVTKPYRGEVGTEHYSGKDRAIAFIQGKTPSTKKGWAFIAVVAVSYAKYLETKSGVNVLTQVRDEIASQGANISIVYME